MENIKWAKENVDSMQCQTLYPPHENRKIKIRVSKRHRTISEVLNLERKKNATNIIDISLEQSLPNTYA